MKRYVFGVLMVAAVLAMGSVLTAAQGRPVLGGYRAIKATDAGAKEAAEFAVEAQAKKTEKEMSLDSVIKAESQTVAGTNYRLCLKVNSEAGEGQDDVEIFVQVVVNRDLKKNFKLVSWAISDCGEDEE